MLKLNQPEDALLKEDWRWSRKQIFLERGSQNNTGVAGKQTVQ